MKTSMEKIGTRGLSLLLAFVMSFSLIIPASMADNESENMEDEGLFVDVDAEESETEDPGEDDTVVIDGENFVAEEDSGDPIQDNEAVILNADDIMPMDDTISGAYVESVKVSDMTDGTAPFDDDNEPGNDQSERNGIVRTFDYVNYTLSYTTRLTDPSVSVDSCTLYAEFVMDVSPEVALFNLDAMVWMNDAVVTYTFKDGTEKTSYTTEEAGNIEKQTLTGLFELVNAGSSVIVPGTGTLSVGIYIGAASNGYEVQPTFKLWLDENNGGRVATATADPVTVSCAPKYALQVKRTTSVDRLGDYDLNTGTNDASTDPVNGKTTVHGRMEAFGITFMQENDTVEKGLKGLCFSSGTVTFDINLSESLTASDGTEITGQNSGWAPILWDYTENASSRSNDSTVTGHWGRILYDRSWAAGAAPANKQGQTSYNVVYCSCYDGGSWKIVQDEQDPFVYHVTIENYTIDTVNYRFPTLDIGSGAIPTADGTTYGANQACISAGYIQCIMQFPEDSSEITQNTSIYMDVCADKFAVDGTEYENVTADYGNSYAVVPTGSITGGVWFAEKTSSSQSSNVLGTGYKDGDAFSYPGNEIRLNQRCNYSGSDPGQTVLGFTKWDAEAVKVTGHTSLTVQATDRDKLGSSEFYYVGREENWASEYEMSNTLINNESLHFFDSIDGLENAGYVCVGGVWIMHGTLAGQGTSYSQCGWYLTVKDTAKIGNVYAAVGEEWLSKDEVYLLSQNGTSSEYKIDKDALLTYDYYVAYCASDTYKTMNGSNSSDRSYIKSVYNGDGNVISGTNVTAYNGGTSLLICGEESQVEAGFDKETYYVDRGDRLATVTVQPSVKVVGTSVSDTGETTTTTVTITVDLPYDLSYRQGTAMWGDTYITPTVTENSDGSSTLTFVLEDVVVGSTDLDAVTFECVIGHAGEADDVTNNQSIEITATISSTNDNKTKDETFGNKVTASMSIIHLSAAGISKETSDPLIERNGDFTWSLLFSNNSSTPITGAHLADVFPYNDDALDSAFSGGFTVNEMTFDFSNAVTSYDEDLNDMELAIAISPVSETSEELVNDGEGYPADWVEIHTTDSGVSVDEANHIVTFDIQGILKNTEHEGSNVYAFYLILGSLEASNYLTITIDVSTYDNKPGDVYNNIFDENADGQDTAVTSIEVTTHVVERSITGLAWIDADQDGRREEGEGMLPGTTVSLYRTTLSNFDQSKDPVVRIINGRALYAAFNVSGKEVEAITTKEDGEYSFEDLEAGTYYVVFSDIPDDNEYGMTARDAGPDTADSDAIGVINSSRNGIDYAYISGIEVPEIEDMTTWNYVSENNDMGVITPTADLTLEKVDSATGKSLSDAVFSITDESGSALTFVRTEDTSGTYNAIYTLSDGSGASTGITAGHILINGLKTGTYTLSETGAPVGYLKMNETGEISVVMQAHDPEAWTETATVSNGDYITSNGDTVRIGNDEDLMDITVTKEWDDNDDQDGKRPEYITIRLFAGGDQVKLARVFEDNDWACSFTDLPKYDADGNEITYTISEDAIDGYKATYGKLTSTDEENVYTISVTNTHEPATTSVTVTKIWDDADNQDGKRPKSITVDLYADGTKVEEDELEEPTYNFFERIFAFFSGSLTPDNEWTYTWTNLPECENGKKIEYTVTEGDVPDGYTSTIGQATQDDNGYSITITNSYTPETIDIEGSKFWEDSDNQDGIRPSYITIRLEADNVEVDHVNVIAAEEWKWSFTDLPKYADGKEITYTVTEDDVAGYDAAYGKLTPTDEGENVYSISVTNTHTPETVNIEGSKTWDDKNNQDGKRPTEITINLLANGGTIQTKTVTATDNCSWSFTDLPKYDNGVEIAYTITEDAVEGYSTVYNGYDVINSYTPEQTSVTVVKAWDDADNQDGLRPDSVTVELYADETATGKTLTLDESNDWEDTFTDLDIYKNGGSKIEYSITETAVTGYTTGITGNASDGYVITNTHDPKTIDISGSKTWNDNNNQDGKRPPAITINLLADGVTVESKAVTASTEWSWSFTELPVYADGKEITYTIAEDAVEGYETTVNGYNVTNSYTPETIDISGSKTWDDEEDQDGKRPKEITINLLADGTVVDSMTVAETDDWSWNFENLPKYRDVGIEIVYTITEDTVENYTAKINGYDVTNEHTPDETGINVQKFWDDNDNQDGVRPTEVTVNLLADGVATGDSLTLNAGNNWAGSFTGLSKYHDHGYEISYTIQEEEDDLPKGYVSTIEKQEGTSTFQITNTHTPETVDVEGSKTWNDNDDQDGARPESITIYLLANGEPVRDEEGKAVTEIVTADVDGNWSWSFTGLPKYENGVEISYHVFEKAVDGYSTEYDGCDITNTHTTEQTSISVYKIWDDADDQDGIRPNSVTLQLLANNEDCGEAVTLNGEDDSWIYTWDELPVYENGNEIEYTVKETNVPEGYDCTVTRVFDSNVFLIENTHTPETVSVEGSKAWDDADDQDGIRPGYITIRLYASKDEENFEEVQHVYVVEDDGWKWSFTDLPKYAGGQEITYTVTEDEIDGYDTTYGSLTLTDENVYTISVTNSHTPETVAVEGSKTWDDNDNQDGKRPSSITIRLLANGDPVLDKEENAVTETVTADDNGNWFWSFTDLPKNSEGREIAYTITEDAVEGYSATYDGYNVINSYTPEQTSVTVTKAWDDENNQDGIRPGSVTVKLYADGVATDRTLTLSEGNGWEGSFTNLDQYRDGGTEIQYTIDEISLDGYQALITGDAVKGYTITNTHTPDTTSVTVDKIWDDADNQDGKRPESITVHLLADGVEVNSGEVEEPTYNFFDRIFAYFSGTLEPDEWTCTWDKLPVYKDGREIKYTVTEDVPDGYTSTIGQATQDDDGYSITITNSYTPETIDISGSKTWVDGDNQDGIRPYYITIRLKADNVEVDHVNVIAAEDWKWSFTDLPKYCNGKVIDYTIEEDAVAGYDTVYSEDDYDVTNIHEPETIDIEGSKTWDDKNNQDGKCPSEITINLLADGGTIQTKTVTATDNWSWSFTDLPKYSNGVEIAYTVTENAVEGYSTVYNGFDVVNSYTPEQTSVTVVKAWDDADNQDGLRLDSVTVELYADETATGKTLTLDESNGWEDTFTDLDIYKNGDEISYSINETAVSGYTTEITGSAKGGYTVTNTHDPETIDIFGSKTWDDSNNQDGKRPQNITINLLADGNQIDSTTVTAVNNWSWSFTELPAYADGKEITYTITENAVVGYTTEITVDDETGGYTVTNTHVPETVDVTGSKTWDDNDDQDGVRPESIKINLLADGTEIKSATVTGDNWSWNFTDLPKYSNGVEIKYTITEDEVPDYDTEITGDAENGYTVTNTHTPETTEITGIKTWVDDWDNKNNTRPDSITVYLLGNGSLCGTATVTEEDGWSWSFTDLPKYENGQEITYQIEERPVDNYSTKYDGYNIINTYTPGETSVSVAKDWEDGNDQDGKRPESVEIVLLANREPTDKTLTLDETNNNWTGTFTGLDIYDTDGDEIIYSVAEKEVPDGYTSTVFRVGSSYTFAVVNTHSPEMTDVIGHKTWDDADDQDGKRPTEITINLLADGEQIDSETVTANDNWSWSFTKLPAYDEGEKIIYTITEDVVEGYETTVNGYNVTNTYTPETIVIEGSKTWEDNDDQDGARPDSIKIHLLADGTEIGSATVTADDWSWSFGNLAKYRDGGTEIVYTITEDAVDDYTTVIDGYDVINTHAPDETSLNVQKFWDDNDNQDGVRPEEVTIQLYADREAVTGKTLTLDADNSWSGSFTGLAKYHDHGEEVVYTVKEVEDDWSDYYTSTVGKDDGTSTISITNTHNPETIDISGSKIWDDNDDQDGIRPNSVTINLLADGTVVGSTTATEENDWSWSFTDLPKYSGGEEINYTITENEVDGYTTAVSVDDETDGYIVTNSHTPATVAVEGSKTWDDADNQDGKRPTEITIRLLADGKEIDSKSVTEAGNWSWSFEDLDQYRDGGVEIIYTVTEDAIDEYSTTYDGYNVINSYTPKQTSVTVTKAWDDGNNQDGIRPGSVTVELYADKVATGRTLTLDESNNWEGTFTELDEYSKGEKITYTIAEISADGYDSSIAGDATEGYVITNTHDPATTSITVDKIWDDNDNQDGKRPDSITVQLLADGLEVEETELEETSYGFFERIFAFFSGTLTPDNQWSYTWDDLPVYKNGVEITYTVTEDAVADYETEITGNAGDGFTITNTHTPEAISIEGSKTWDDADNQDGIRPKSVTINLFADDEKVDSRTVTEEDNWSWSFTGLPKYSNGSEIEYTVEEDAVAGYDPVYSSDGYDVTNIHEPETIDIEGSKTWDDNEDQDGERPASITIHLLADGKEVDSKIVTEADNWSWSFKGLDQYRDGGVGIVYTITEDTVEDYTTTIDGYDVTNEHTPGKTGLNVQKIWLDDHDQDGVRPEEITVTLLKNGEKTDQTLTLNEENDWYGSFTDLDVYEKGQEITYSVAEVSVSGYVSNIDQVGDTSSVYIYNEHTSATVDATGTKTWVDNNNQDGIRPDSVTISLMADGEPALDENGEEITATVTAANGWTYAFTGLPKYHDHGIEIVYSVTEDTVTGYTTDITGSVEDGYTVTNTHDPETIDVSGSKSWEDNNNQDGRRPAEITIHLYADGTEIDRRQVTAADDWSWSFTGLDKYRDGIEIVYTIAEDKVTDYATEISGYDVINTHEPDKTSLNVEKLWDDNDNQDGIRPGKVTVSLLADDEETGLTLTLNAGNDWSGTFSDLDKYAGGQEITYTVQEDITVVGYESKVAPVENTSTVRITNSHTPETVDVEGSKTWIDNDDQDGARPESITIYLLANGEPVRDEEGKAVTEVVTPDGEGNWTWSFTDLPKYENGTEISYHVYETAIDGYAAEYDGYDITNTHTTEQTSISVYKTWDDAGNQDGLRPDSVTVELYADGTETGQTLTLNAGNNWTGTFTGLDKYAAGEEISYTVEETGVPDGYSCTVNRVADSSVFVIENRHTPETVNVEGSKTWYDNENQDGIRPGYITIRLYADGEEIDHEIVVSDDNWAWSFTGLPKYSNGTEIEYTITEDPVEGYETAVEGYNVTNTHEPVTVDIEGSKTWNDADDQDGKRPEEITINLLADGETIESRTVTAEDGWSWSFKGLDQYRDGGVEIIYTVTENALDDYSTTYDGYDVINSYTPEQTSVTVTKAWDDADDQDGIRPDSVTVKLYADGAETGQTLTLDESSNWEGTFTELDEYSSGVKIAYSIDEISVDGYQAEISGDAVTGFTITNTHEPAATSVTVNKIWDDNDNQDGIRPDSVTVRLYADGVEVKETELEETTYGFFERIFAFFSGTLTPDNQWTYTWDDLPVYKNGVEITYTVTEDAVADYETEITGNAGDGFTITNTHAPETIDIEGSKTWDDADNQDGRRPEDITINLLADGKNVGSRTVTEADGWSWSFEGLDKYRDSGVEIAYTITEDKADGYETTVNGYNVTNSYTPETVDISGSKTWNDADNQDGIRPESITIRLLADGEEIDSRTVTEADNWSWSFTDLPKYSGGVEISYIITEDAIDNYATGYDGYDVTNSYTPGQTSVTVVKDWDDADDQDGIRTDSVTVELFADETATGRTLTLDESNNWEGTFTDLDEYSSGVKIEYTVVETGVEGYETGITGNAAEGYVITNTHAPAVTSVTASKIWDDADNQDGIRPDSVTINLLADGEKVDSRTVTAEDNWSLSFTDLPKYSAGDEIDYTVTENEVDGYTAIVTADDETGGYIVTNSHTPATITVEGSKTWDDADNQDGIRPAEITINLLADGETIRTETVTAADNWSWSFEGLDQYRDGGVEIVYTVTENAVDDYTPTYNGYDITNSYTPGQTSVSVTKAWDDGNDQDGIRPDSIDVILLADGSETGQTLTLDESNEWTGIFTNLDEYRNGEKIAYTIQEATAADGYTGVTTGDAQTGYTITNTHTPATIDIPVEKTWEDNDNAYNHRPDSVQVELLADGTDTGIGLTLSGENNWSGVFEDLAKYADGREIGYTVQEISDEALQYYTPTVSGSTETGFTIVNHREYFDLDEEIVVDEDDRDSWVKNESVNAYNAIEIEMSTYLPYIEAEELENGEFTMNFHEVLDHDMVLDEIDTDFTVSIAGYRVSHDYYTISIDPDDGCSFHVDVDLTALYVDGVITEDDLQGETELMVFFYADLEGTGLNGSYKSTAWYEVYDGDEWQYTSNEDVVEFYTYEILVLKYDASALEDDDYEGAALAGAVLGLYYDAGGENPVIRNDEPYTAMSGDDGEAMFYGLAEGTYYVMELEAPDGYVLSDQAAAAAVNQEMDGYIREILFANEPAAKEEPRAPEKTADVGDGTEVSVGDEITYTITYYNHNDTEADVTIIDVLDNGLDFVSATEGGVYDADAHAVTWTIGNAAPLAEGSVDLTVIVNENADRADGVSNTAGVQIGNDESAETNTVVNPVEPEEPVPGATPEKSVDVGEGTQVSVGEELTYTITYYNDEDTEADVQITDILDNGVDFLSATEGGVYDADAHAVTWTIENAAPQTGGSVELTVTVNENADRADGVSNTASVQIGNGASADTNTVNNPLQSDETTAGPVDPEKSVNVGDGTEVSAGEELTYTITYYNNYNEAVTVVITDALDAGVDFLSATEGGVYDADAHAVTWTIENAAAQTEGSVELTVTVNENADRADGVSNTASVKIGDDTEVDTNAVTNPLKAEEETPVTGNPDNGNNGNNGSTGSNGGNSGTGGTGSSGGTTSGNGGNGTTGTGNVKTGEIIGMSVVGAAALAAIAGIIATIVSRKRRENE